MNLGFSIGKVPSSRDEDKNGFLPVSQSEFLDGGGVWNLNRRGRSWTLFYIKKWAWFYQAHLFNYFPVLFHLRMNFMKFSLPPIPR
jgi:hypothetical protein